MRYLNNLFSAVIQRKGSETPFVDLFSGIEIRDIPFDVRQKAMNVVELSPSFAFFRHQMCIAPPIITCLQKNGLIHIQCGMTTPIKVFLSVFCSVMMTLQMFFFTSIGNEVAKKATVLRYLPGILAIAIAGATLLDFSFSCRAALRELKEAISKNDKIDDNNDSSAKYDDWD